MQQIDTSGIDIMQHITTPVKRVAATNGGEWHGPCPMCGGKDRFIVWPKTGRWICRQCNERGGDVIGLVMQSRRMDFKAALQHLGLSGSRQYAAPTQTAKRYVKHEEPQDEKPNDVYWSESNRFAYECAVRLQSQQGERIRAYLLKRGFTADFADRHLIGYNERPRRETWGNVEIYVPEGITIPYLPNWTRDATPTKIKIRNMAMGGPKYTTIKGGQNTLYNGWTVQAYRVVVLVESELDALSVLAGVNHHAVTAVATGSTGGARTMPSIALLATARRVLVAYDADDAGEGASQFWLGVLPNARRARPTRHDINDMLTAGDDLRQWIKEMM